MKTRFVVATLALLAIALTATVASAGILADIYAKKVGDAVYKTEVYSLDIVVGPKSVIVRKCVDGLRIIYDGSRRSEVQPMWGLQNKVRAVYGKAVGVTTFTPGNCADDPAGNVIMFVHEGKAGDIAFFNAVEKVLNGWLPGSTVVKK
jgi:hypothetical protein